MFGLFKKKTELEKLNDRYKALLKEAHELSTQDRRKSDAKVAEANEILQRIERLENQEG